MSKGASHYLPRQRQPELEREYSRSPSLGYEEPEGASLVRCLSHGFPTPLARWHCHDEYELHLIVATSGKAFVGDWIGPFSPGHLVLCGPRLPHNWISADVPDEGVAERDLVIQFAHEPIARAAQQIAELADVLPLLDRARHGIEFFGLAGQARMHWHRVKQSHGIERFAAFCEYLSDLARCGDYRLLSDVKMQHQSGDTQLDQVNAIVDHIASDLTQPVSAAQAAAKLDMSASRFSRFFRRATGNTYTDFVNRIRIHRACQLLMETDRQITHICYEVGFNNVANFNRRFLDIKGMKPGEFRRQTRQRFGEKQ